MEVSTTNLKGKVSISNNAIATIAGNAAKECYGVLGLANKYPPKNNEEVVLSSEDYIKGINVRHARSGIEIDLYICVAYGIKITEIVNEVQKKVRYVLKKTLNLDFSVVNVYVQSVKVL